MIGKILDVITNPQTGAHLIIIKILKYILTGIFASIFYSLIFGEFNIIQFDSFIEFGKYILEGQFIKPLILYFLTWHLFYSILQWFINRREIKMTKYVLKIYEALNQESSKKIPNFFTKQMNWALNVLLETSILRIEGRKIIMGYSFHKVKKTIEDMKEGKDEINLSYLTNLYIVIIQLIILLWIFEIRNNMNSPMFCVIVSLIGLIVLFFIRYANSLVITLRIYSEPIYKKILEIEEKNNKILLDLDKSQSQNKELNEPEADIRRSE